MEASGTLGIQPIRNLNGIPPVVNRVRIHDAGVMKATAVKEEVSRQSVTLPAPLVAEARTTRRDLAHGLAYPKRAAPPLRIDTSPARRQCIARATGIVDEVVTGSFDSGLCAASVADPHFHLGQRVYSEAVEFVPLSSIRGAEGYPNIPEHAAFHRGLILVAQEGKWSEYAIPPIRLNEANEIVDGNHRANSARRTGDPNVLVPTIKPGPKGIYPEWRASDSIIPRYVVYECSRKDRFRTGIVFYLDPESNEDPLNGALCDLFSRAATMPVIAGNTEQEGCHSVPGNIFKPLSNANAVLEIVFKRVDIVGSRTALNKHFFVIAGCNFKARTWREFFENASVDSEPAPRFLSKTLNQLFDSKTACQEIQIGVVQCDC